MRIIYISNVMNHHTKSIADELYSRLGDGFLFVETQQMKNHNSLKGSSFTDFSESPYLYSIYNDNYKKISEEKLLILLNKCDVVLQGAASDKYIKNRLKYNLMTFRISEHILKNTKLNFLRLIKYYIRNHKIRNKNIYLLCASSHVAFDMERSHSHFEKTFKWGYFPSIFNKEKPDFFGQILNILWVGRLIEWKHPEYIIYTARFLCKKNISATITVIGDGPLLRKIKNIIENEKLESYVNFIGKVDSKKVQCEMRKADLFLFNSGIGEGWGAVLNESMGNACIPIANEKAGSTNFLIDDGINGFIYNDSLESFYKVLNGALQLSESKIKEMKMNAYKTIMNEWSSEVAVKRLLSFINDNNQHEWVPYQEGPMSDAK